MKFAKELASKMVQEWQAAYIDYNSLKQVLKNLMIFRQQRAAMPAAAAVSQRRSYNARESSRSNGDSVVTVSSVRQEQSAQNYYRTVFQRSMDEGGGFELEFFAKLDDELNKVVKFYKDRVEWVKMEAEELRNALVSLRNNADLLDVEQNSAVPFHSGREKQAEISFCKESRRGIEACLHPTLQTASTFEKLLFLEFASSFLNLLAFSKIMKKYDKITSRNASNAYIKMLDSSYLATSDEVYELMEGLEATFIEHFATGKHKKGNRSLSLVQKREKHRTTFLLGVFTGCSVALVGAIIVSLHGRKLLDHPGQDQYMESIFPLYSLFVFIVLHLLMYGSNAYLWRQLRVNYPSIFGCKPETELGFREVLLLASALSILSLAVVLSNLDIEMDPSTLTELVPLALLIVVLLVTFCPFNVIYPSSRFFLLHHAWYCASAPFHKGTFTDFFLADQLTSQVQAFRSLLFYVFYYAMGDFTTRSNAFLTARSYKILYIVVAIIPSWSRLLQCLRRLYEEKDRKQGFNALKYLSTIVALSTRTIYDQKRGNFWRKMAASTSGITTIYSTYWDIVFDWGLLQKNSRNPWLREELLIPYKAVYFVAIVANILLRLVWMQSVLDFNETEFLHRRAVVALVACLEILRRGIWNFFRLENEHFHQVGKNQVQEIVLLPS